ncbi:MAG: transcription antitermination factor NusB [Thermodesulfovibrionales bacterium]|nr:transcription antitermination factor NusB [Thermodesulfovibrionales bacterium]
MKRRKAREYALQYLYRIEFVHLNLDLIEDSLTAFWHEQKEPNLEIISFAEKIIKGTISRLEDIDKFIESTAQNWKPDRITTIDKTILRIAIYELLEHQEIPQAVIIDEAIEIAKKFSTNESSAFINGILDKLARHKIRVSSA